MLFALALALDIATAPTAPCSPAVVDPSLQIAVADRRARDVAGAKATIEAASRCPVRDGPTYGAHVLRAELAAEEQDWATVRAMLAGVPLHPETSIGARAAFLDLRVYQSLGNAKAFTALRTIVLTLNDAALIAAGGHKRETFAVPGGTVAAYDAAIDQGAFHRVYEFVATPTDPAAYPVTIQLTDDRSAIAIAKSLAKPDARAVDHVWFVDLYTCDRHMTLTPPGNRTGDQPSYDEIRARVVATFADPSLLAAAPPPEKSECRSGIWILPGFGAPRKPD